MALVALDKATGKVRWTTPRNQGQGFSTPRLVPVAGGRIDLVLNGPQGVWGYDPRTGKELWHCLRSGGDKSLFGEPLPVSDGAMMFIESGRPGHCLAFRLPGSGDVTKTNLVWDGQRKGRDVASPVLYNGLLYAADNKCSLTCYDWKTGKELNTKRLDTGNGKSLASPIVVRGKILWVLDEGTTVVQEPGPELKVVARNRLGEGAALDFGASPAVVDGKLFIRSQSNLYCIGEKK
jgi:outer membrane protein assembly factor BamB